MCVNISNNGSGSQVFKKLKNYIQVDIDEVYMSTKFGGMTSLVLEILLFFRFGQISLSDHGGQKIKVSQKIYASIGWCEIHASQFWWVWPFQFRSYGSFLLAFKNGQNFPLDHGL